MIGGLAVGRRMSKTFTPDMSSPRRFAPRAMSSRRWPHLHSWISQRANMARQRHLKISYDQLIATLVIPAVCQTSAYQENKFGRFLPTSVACAKHASFCVYVHCWRYSSFVAKESVRTIVLRPACRAREHEDERSRRCTTVIPHRAWR